MSARWREASVCEVQHQDSVDEYEGRMASLPSSTAPGDIKLADADAEAGAAAAAATAHGGDVVKKDSAGGWADGLSFRRGRGGPSAADEGRSSSSWVYRPPDWVPIGIRASPRLNAAVRPGEFLQPGEVFEVVDTQRGDGSQVTFLKLARGGGWVFDQKPECGVLCLPYDEEDTEVELCTYKLTLPFDCLLSIVKKLCVADADAYHVGVTVYGREWAFFSGCDVEDGPDTTGVRYLRQGSWAPRLCRIVSLGRTPLTELEANAVIQALEDEWPSGGYRFLTRNCCHFSQEMCRRLKVGPIPDKVLRLDLYASSEVVDIVKDGKELMGRARTESFHTSDFCCGLAAYGRKSRGRGIAVTSCFGAMRQPYYWLRGVSAFVRRVNRREEPFGPSRSRKFEENH